MADCFVHASDLHLDAPLGNLGMLDEERRGDLSERAARAWDRLVQLCIDREASFLVLAGDIFHEAAAGDLVQQVFLHGLEQLDCRGVHVFICHGNHDPLIRDSQLIGKLPQRVVRFEPGEPQSRSVELRSSREVVQVSGVSFRTRSETENLALRFHGLEPLPGSVAHIAVMHANVGAKSEHDPYAPCEYDDLDKAPVDYWALGHIHKRNVRPLRKSGAWAAYCGNLQGRSFKPSECGPKGALVVPIESRHIDEPEFVPCDQVRFVRSELPVHPDDTISSLRANIADEASLQGGKHPNLPVAWRLQLTGTNTEVARRHTAIVSGKQLRDLADELSGRLNGGGLCQVGFSVRRAIDRKAILAAKDLRAAVLTKLYEFGLAGEAGDATTPELTELLRDGLPETLESEWDEMIDESPEIMGDVLALAERLLLGTYSNAQDEMQ